MKIRFDKDGFVDGYVDETVANGGMQGAVPFDGEIPKDFGLFCSAYQLLDGRLVLNQQRYEEIQEQRNRWAQMFGADEMGR